MDTIPSSVCNLEFTSWWSHPYLFSRMSSCQTSQDKHESLARSHKLHTISEANKMSAECIILQMSHACAHQTPFLPWRISSFGGERVSKNLLFWSSHHFILWGSSIEENSISSDRLCIDPWMTMKLKLHYMWLWTLSIGFILLEGHTESCLRISFEVLRKAQTDAISGATYPC